MFAVAADGRTEIENHSKQNPIIKESTSDENHSAIITLVSSKEHNNTHRGFSISFERIGEFKNSTIFK